MHDREVERSSLIGGRRRNLCRFALLHENLNAGDVVAMAMANHDQATPKER